MPHSSFRQSCFESTGESSVAPPQLFDTPRWYACRTRARAEKRADNLLSGRGVEAYLPLVEEVRQWSDRKKRVALPLFPGYVFARFDLRKTYEVLNTAGIVTIVRANGYPTPLRDEELESVRILVTGVNAGQGMPSPVETVTIGQQVVATRGVFAGIRGVLLETRGRTRVVVQLSVLCQAVSVEVPRRVLRSCARERGSAGGVEWSRGRASH